MKTTKALDIMTAPVVTARPDMLLDEVIRLLLRWHISGLPVVDDGGRLVGVISEHDVMNFAFSGDAADTRVEEAMSREVVTFGPDADIETLVNACATKRIRRIPITTGDRKVVGIVSRRDILREMNRLYNRY